MGLDYTKSDAMAMRGDPVQRTRDKKDKDGKGRCDVVCGQKLLRGTVGRTNKIGMVCA